MKLFILFILLATPSMALGHIECEEIMTNIFTQDGAIFKGERISFQRCENNEVVCYHGGFKDSGISCKFK